MNRFLILVLLFTGFTSCNKEVTEPLTNPNTETTTVSLTASLKDAETRVSPNTNSDVEWTFAWEDDDEISAWYSNCTEVNKFSIETYDALSSTFTGSVEATANNHRFIYPYETGKIASTVSPNGYSIDLSTQDGELNKTYFINDTQIETSSIANGTVSALSMKHLGAFMVVDIYLEGDKTYTLEGVSYEGIPVEAVIDMTKTVDDNDFYINMNEGIVEATGLGIEFTKVEGTQYLQAITRLNILPFDVAAGGSLTINITLGVNGTTTKELSTTVTNDSTEPVSFARATHNFTYLTVSDMAASVEITGATINDWEQVENEDIPLTEVSAISHNSVGGVYEINSGK